jgi:hypothetical protein
MRKRAQLHCQCSVDEGTADLSMLQSVPEPLTGSEDRRRGWRRVAALARPLSVGTVPRVLTPLPPGWLSTLLRLSLSFPVTASLFPILPASTAPRPILTGIGLVCAALPPFGTIPRGPLLFVLGSGVPVASGLCRAESLAHRRPSSLWVLLQPTRAGRRRKNAGNCAWRAAAAPPPRRVAALLRDRDPRRVTRHHPRARLSEPAMGHRAMPAGAARSIAPCITVLLELAAPVEAGEPVATATAEREG